MIPELKDSIEELREIVDLLQLNQTTPKTSKTFVSTFQNIIHPLSDNYSVVFIDDSLVI